VPSLHRALHRGGRILRFLAIVTLALEGLYVLAVNVFLSTTLFEKVVDATPESVDIHFTRGWSIVPTRVHARRLSIRGTDSHIEWILKLDEVEFECSLLALLRKEFRVTMAHGRGITFRARFKVASPAATSKLEAELPPIDSLGPVGLLPSEPPYAGASDDKKWNLWTVSIQGADAEHVREVWIEHARFLGEAHIQGGFYLKPIRRVEVLPSAVAIRAGSVLIDSRVALDNLVASADLALGSFDPRTSGSILRLLLLSGDASLEIPDVGDLGLTRGDGPALSGKVAVPHLGLRIVNGVVRNGSALQSKAYALTVREAKREISGEIDLTARVEHDRLAARVTVEDLKSSLLVEAPLLTVVLDSAELALGAPLGDLHAVVDIPDARLNDAARLSDVLGAESPLRVLGGELRGSGHGELWRREPHAAGRISVRGTALDLRAGEASVLGDAEMDASVDSLRLDTLVATGVHATLLIPEASLARAAAPKEPFIRLAGLRAHGDAVSHDFAQAFHSLQAEIEVPTIEFFDRDSLRSALGIRSSLRLASRRARLGASAQVRVDGNQVSGTLEAHASDVGLEGEGRRLTTALQTRVRAHASDWRRGVFTLDDARVVAAHVALADEGRSSGLTVRRIVVTAATGALRLDDPLRDLRFAVTVDGGHLVDPSVLHGLTPAGTTVTLRDDAGSIEGKLAGSVTEGVVQGRLSAAVRGVGITRAEVHVVGDAHASVDVARWDLEAQTLHGNAEVTLEQVSGGFDPRAVSPDFAVEAISLRLSTSALNLGRPALSGVDYDLDVKTAELIDARALNVFLPSSDILAIESGRAYARLHASGDARGNRGVVDVRLAQGGIVLGETHVLGDFELAVRAGEATATSAKGAAAVDLEGSRLALRHVRVTGASTDASDWTGDLMVESGRLRLGSAPRLEADLTLRADDANPLLGLLFRDSLSPTLASWTHMPTFTAVTHVVAEPQKLVVSELLASGGNLSVRGTMILRPRSAGGTEGGTQGAFVVHKGPWSVGVNLDSRGTSLRLFGLDGWYRSRVDELVPP
jgi:hypothetical protein